MSIFSELFGNSKDLKLMELLKNLSAKVQSSLTYLNQLLTEYDDVDQVKTCVFKIQSLENEGDELVKQIIELLSEISITTWISHEMVLRMIHVLDDILDNNQSIIRFLEYYRLSKISKDMILLGGILDKGGNELNVMMNLVCEPGWQKHTKKILNHIKAIREMEHQGDIIKSQGLHSLLNVENDDKPITMRDLAEFRSSEKMLETLEQLTDHIHLLSSIVHQCLSD